MAVRNPKRDSCCEKRRRECRIEESNATCSRKGTELQTLLQRNMLKWNFLPTENRLISDPQLGLEKPIDLERRIQKKVLELVDKEETLVNLYKKAAEEARKREEELKDKTAKLMQQIERDKDLIKRLKQANLYPHEETCQTPFSSPNQRHKN